VANAAVFLASGVVDTERHLSPPLGTDLLARNVALLDAPLDGHRRVHKARQDGVDANAVPRVLECHVLRHRVDGTL